MGMQSHEQLQEIRQIAGSPPEPSARCGGQKYLAPYDGRDGRWVDCNSPASRWVPEVRYCSHHMPVELAQLANRRLELYHELVLEVWEHVLAEHPLP